MAGRLPQIFPVTDLDVLSTEVRSFNLLPECEKPKSTDVAVAWHEVRQMKNDDQRYKFPMLSKLSAACSSLFHGNADIERCFGKMHDIDQNVKRNRLSGTFVYLFLFY